MKKYIYTILLIMIGVVFYSCDDSTVMGPTGPSKNNLLFSEDSLVSHGNHSSFLFYMGNDVHKIRLNFTLQTNDTLPPSDPPYVWTDINIFDWNLYKSIFQMQLHDSTCNGIFSFNIDLPPNDFKYVSGEVAADTTNGRRFSIKMYNISLYKLE